MLQMKSGVVAPEKGGCRLGWVQTLGIWVLVHSEHRDGVAVRVHAGSGWISRHLTSSVHPSRVMDRQHHPLPAVDRVVRVHAGLSWIPLLLLCELKKRDTKSQIRDSKQQV